MNRVVTDIDFDETATPRMQAIRDQLAKALDGLCPVMGIKTDDNIMSSVIISGSLDPREEWANGIYENSRYFRLMLSSKGSRYYEEGNQIVVEL